MQLLKDQRKVREALWAKWDEDAMEDLESACTLREIAMVLKSTPLNKFKDDYSRNRVYLKMIKLCSTLDDVFFLLSINIGGVDHFWEEDCRTHMTLEKHLGTEREGRDTSTPAMIHIREIVLSALKGIESKESSLLFLQNRNIGRISQLFETVANKGLSFCGTDEEKATYNEEAEKCFKKIYEPKPSLPWALYDLIP